MIYPDNFEQKIGFNEIRNLLRERCLSTLGKEQVAKMHFSSDADEVNEWLLQTREFRRLMEEVEDFPLQYFYDVRESIVRIRVENTHLEEDELFDLRRSLSTIDGIVKTINGTGVQTGEPVLVVAGEDKLYVEGVIDEFSYANVKKGSMITAISWDTGNTFQARITEISTYPETGSSYNLSSSQNPNVSYYPFTAVITDELVEVSAGETVNIGFDGISSRLFLPLAYIRSEGSKSYVYVRGGSNRLEKRAVTTGQSLYNTVIEITSGLENDDYIAFPYGNNIREGANTVISKDASDLVY